MSLWIGNKEVGLSSGQTAGQVGGNYIIRPEGSDISKPYIPGVGSTSIMIEGGAIAGKGGEGVGVTTTIRRDQYGNVIGIKQIGSSGETIFERKPTIGGGYVEVGIPIGVQSRYAEIEKTKAEMPLYRAGAEYRARKEVERKIESDVQNLINQGYKPYVTIEGTTLYSKTTPKKDVTVPKFGKMVQRGEITEPFLGVFTPDAFIDQVDYTQRKISIQIEKLDKEISEKYGLTEIVEPAVKTFRHAQFLAEREEKYKKIGGGQSELGKAGSEFAIGFVEEAAQKPITAAGNALFALLVTKGVSGLASKAPILTKGIGTGKIASKVNAVNILGAGLAGMYGYDVTTRSIAAEDKARFAGQITATEILPFAVGGYLGTKKLPIQYETIKTPSNEVLYKGFTIANQPIIGASKTARLILGTPSVKQVPRIGIKEYMPVTKLETNIMAREQVMKAYGYSQTEITKVKIGLQLMKETEFQMSKFTEGKILRGTKTISEKGTDVFLKYVKSQNKIVDKIYGSFGARSQLKPEYRRLPGDIDIMLTTDNEGAIKFTKTLADKLRASGEKVRVSKTSDTLIETYGKGGEHHAIDVHYKGEPSTDILTPGEETMRYGLQLGQKTIKIEDFSIMPLSEQGIRKGSSVLTWRQKGKIAPAAHRLKDIPDFLATQITLLESKYGIIPNNHQKLINEWANLFPEAKGLTGEAKIPIDIGKQSPKVINGNVVFKRSVTPQQSLSTSKGAKQYQEDYIKTVSQSASTISQRSKYVIPYESTYKNPSPPSKTTYSKIRTPNIDLAYKIISPGTSIPVIKYPPRSPYPSGTPYPSRSPSPYPTPEPKKIKMPPPPPEEYLFRKPPPPKKYKNFVEAVNDRVRRNKKKKWVWDVNNPIPTLEEIVR